MAAKIKKNKKGFRTARPSKKEIEIPVHVIKQAQQMPDISNSFLQNNIDDFEKKSKTFGEAGVPFFYQGSFSLNQHSLSEEKLKMERQSTPKSKFEMLTQMETRKKRFFISQSQKEKIMWISVALITGIIFFIWFLTIKSHFSSFRLGQSSFFVLQSTEGTSKNLYEEWDNLRNQWTGFQNALKLQSTAVSANQQVINKLKEKILTEELKNQLEKSSETSQVNVNH